MVKEINIETIEVVEGVTDAIAIHIYVLLSEAEKEASFADEREGLAFLEETYSLNKIKDWKNDFVITLWDKGVFVGFGRAKEDGWITHVYVGKDFQGRGVGTRILVLLEQRLTENGTAELFLNADPKTQDFYRKYGWKEKNENPILLLPMVKVVKPE